MSTRAPRVPADLARRRIAEAAERLLATRRFRDLTIDDVMREAGLARTVFYRHFDGLPHVMLGLLDDLLAGVVAEAQVGDPTDRTILRRQLELVVRTYREHGALLRALDDAAHHHPEVERAVRDWVDDTVDISAMMISAGVARGHTPPMPVREVARALTHMNGHYLLDLVAHDPAFDEDAAVAALWTVWTRTTWPDP